MTATTYQPIQVVCEICSEVVSSTDIRLLPVCGHCFCVTCIDETSAKHAPDVPPCPTCRVPFPPLGVRHVFLQGPTSRSISIATSTDDIVLPPLSRRVSDERELSASSGGAVRRNVQQWRDLQHRLDSVIAPTNHHVDIPKTMENVHDMIMEILEDNDATSGGVSGDNIVVSPALLRSLATLMNRAQFLLKTKPEGSAFWDKTISLRFTVAVVLCGLLCAVVCLCSLFTDFVASQARPKRSGWRF
ncbi:hypothetical protein BXZ70DRAFT_1005484 [Cristinia sonorae]|uniref:RING-type domain-containing protein n=1 Tax=Cristinia sonorae TaxID=1940300 RepID=A0A8K0UTW5_9AGAR|nr:hypothetical protein BXZ70DRAFT_1005484 [Cristinia sonorae]